MGNHRRSDTARQAPVVLVSATGTSEGVPGAAAAFACAAAGMEHASLLVDLRGKQPRPTLIASSPARELEARLSARLIGGRVVARGRVCWLASRLDAGGLDMAAAAVGIAHRVPSVLLVPARGLEQALSDGPRPTGVLLCVDAGADQAELARTVHELGEQGIEAGILKRRLGWVSERRALFGTLAASSPDGLPESLVAPLLGAWAEESLIA